MIRRNRRIKNLTLSMMESDSLEFIQIFWLEKRVSDQNKKS